MSKVAMIGGGGATVTEVGTVRPVDDKAAVEVVVKLVEQLWVVQARHAPELREYPELQVVQVAALMQLAQLGRVVGQVLMH